MSPSRSHPDQLTRRRPRPDLGRGRGLRALASLVALAAVGCKGEEAFYARTATSGVGGGGGVVGGGGGAAGNTGQGGGAMAGQGGKSGTGGVGGAGNKGGSGGMAGGAAGQGGVGGVGGAPPTGMFGDHCQSSADCKQGSCQSKFCCNVDCGGTCQTCDSSGNSCTDVTMGQDPRVDCPAASQMSCGNKGGCNGAGACTLWEAGVSCSSASTCSGTGAVIHGSVCNGQGSCNMNAPVSCNSFLCQSNACLTNCNDGTACVSGGFCGAGTCVGPTPNLAGNGDLEYGTTDGWAAIPNGAGLSLSSTVMNSGTYSAQQTSRATFYIGPGYYIPTGLGIYNISLWAMQNQVTGASLPRGLLQLRLNCAQNIFYYAGNLEQGMTSGAWVNFTATIDTSMDPNVPSDCFANPTLQGAVPGLVKSAVVLFDQDMKDSPVPGKTTFPDFYVDDLVVTVDDQHNLVGNPNFEAPGGFVDGWSTNALDVKGAATLSVSTTQHNGGTNSLWAKSRSLWNVGIRYALPIGAADYAVTFYVMQSGATSHQLQLVAAYSCLGDPANSIRQKTLATTSPKPGGMWTALSASAVAFPPSDAPRGCKMTNAAFWVTQVEQGACGTGTGQVECPDLFLDDANITLTNAPPTD
jgi:hypothetical protein